MKYVIQIVLGNFVVKKGLIFVSFHAQMSFIYLHASPPCTIYLSLILKCEFQVSYNFKV